MQGVQGCNSILEAGVPEIDVVVELRHFSASSENQREDGHEWNFSLHIKMFLYKR